MAGHVGMKMWSYGVKWNVYIMCWCIDNDQMNLNISSSHSWMSIIFWIRILWLMYGINKFWLCLVCKMYNECWWCVVILTYMSILRNIEQLYCLIKWNCVWIINNQN